MKLYQFNDTRDPNVAVAVAAETEEEAGDLVQRLPSEVSDLDEATKACLVFAGEAGMELQLMIAMGLTHVLTRQSVEKAEDSVAAYRNDSLKLFRYGECTGTKGAPCRDIPCKGFFIVAAESRDDADAIIKRLPDSDESARAVLLIGTGREVTREDLPHGIKTRIISRKAVERHEARAAKRATAVKQNALVPFIPMPTTVN